MKTIMKKSILWIQAIFVKVIRIKEDSQRIYLVEMLYLRMNV